MCFLENISLVQKKQKKAAFRLRLSFLQNIRRLLKNLEGPRFHSVPFSKHFKLKEMRGQKLIDGASVKHLITKYFQNVHFFLKQFFRIEALQLLFSFFRACQSHEIVIRLTCHCY